MFDEHGRRIYRGQEALDKFAESLGSRLREAHKLHYKTTFQNLPISIENRKGSVRRGTDNDGEEWETKMKHPYGYIRGTKGPDGDAVDVFVGPNEDAAYAYVIHSNNPETGEFDEDKVMLGFNSSKRAKEVFMQHYDDPKFFGGIDRIPMWQFSEKVFVKKHTLKKLVASMRESSRSIPQGVGATGLDQSMKRAMLGNHQPQMINPEVREGGPGSGPRVRLYHGTTSSNAKKIRREGLKLQKSGGQTVPHVTTSKKDAMEFAKLTAKDAGGGERPVVISLKPEASKFFDDGKIGEMGTSSMRSSNKTRIHPKYIESREAREPAFASLQVPQDMLEKLIKSGQAPPIRNASKGGIREHGTKGMHWGQHSPREVIEHVVGKENYKGAMEHPNKGTIHLFDDPATRNTLAMYEKKIRDPQTVRDHIADSRAKYGHESRRRRSFESRLGSFLTESRRSPGTYYARELARYDTDAEEADVDLIRESFGGRVDFPRTKRHGDLGMGYFHEKIDRARRVVIKPTRGKKLTAGVFSEAKHAIKKGIPVYGIHKGRLRRVKNVEALGSPNKEGHFGRVIYRRKRK